MNVMKIIFSLLVFLIFSGCYNTTQPMKTINTTMPKGKFVKISKKESKSTFALAKLITDIDRGETIFTFPAKATTKGLLCNASIKDGDVTYSGGKKYLGDWSTELGDIFYEELTRLGYNIAGDPKDLFNANASVSSAEYLIAGRVIKMTGNFCSDHDFWYGLPTNKYSGEMSVTVEWSVLNTLTKNIVLNETITGYYKLEKPEKEGITTVFENAFAISSENFAKSVKLRNLAVGKKIVATNDNNSKKEIKITQGKSQKEFNIDNLRSNIVTIRIGQGHGSGFFVGNNGYLLTNAHVVGDSKSVQIITSSGMEIEGQVIRKSKSRDVSLIKVPLKITNSLNLKFEIPDIASDVYAAGTPIDEALKTTVTKGIISNIRVDNASGLKFIQADASISPGNSGGPLFDKFGNVIGISVAKYNANSAEGLGLFIPLQDAFSSIKLSIE
tara:strand:+ start:237 stop:1562 length:1326 start_codon:yes stop_codon:yes gene_type:complete